MRFIPEVYFFVQKDQDYDKNGFRTNDGTFIYYNFSFIKKHFRQKQAGYQVFDH